MNVEQAQGKWQQIKGKFQSKWGRFTENELDQSEGNIEELIGKMTEYYGLSKEEAMDKVQSFLNRFDDHGMELHSIANRISDAAENINEKAHDAVEACREYSKEKPFTAMGIIATAGLILGMLISRTGERH